MASELRHPTDDELLEPIANANLPASHKEQLGAVIRAAHVACGSDRDLMIKALVGGISIIASSVGPTHGPEAVDLVMRHCADAIEGARLKLAEFLGRLVAPRHGEPS